MDSRKKGYKSLQNDVLGVERKITNLPNNNDYFPKRISGYLPYVINTFEPTLNGKSYHHFVNEHWESLLETELLDEFVSQCNFNNDSKTLALHVGYTGLEANS